MNFDNKDIGHYESEDAYEDLESIRAILHDAKRRINRNKLEKAEISLTFIVGEGGREDGN